RAANPRPVRPAFRSILAMYEGHHFFKEKFAVAIGPPSAQLRSLCWRVLAYPRLAQVGDAHDNKRFDIPGTYLRIRGLTDVPILPLNKGRRAIKKILSVLEIQDRKAPLGLLVITRRQIDHEAPLISQEP